ncbi:hypothetical protein [Corynebacterium cystitidis]|uniref:hypothetical protein n=1 Tax=Corynebacterium cystitidis TaxID=35757 RepID=UPI000B8889FB|nr:hypothetical protein [Corynebacterium cystitidis]
MVRGEREASLEELANLSGATGLPLSYFLRSDSLPESTSVAARATYGASMKTLQTVIWIRMGFSGGRNRVNA